MAEARSYSMVNQDSDSDIDQPLYNEINETTDSDSDIINQRQIGQDGSSDDAEPIQKKLRGKNKKLQKFKTYETKELATIDLNAKVIGGENWFHKNLIVSEISGKF